MAVLDVVKYPSTVLLRPARQVKNPGPEEDLLVRDMIDTMHDRKGVGLAANQVGVSKRIFVASPDGKKGGELVFINPRIIKRSGNVCDEEGCLSIPGHSSPVRRYKKVVLSAENKDGKKVEIEAEGLLARIFQHETDHLDGKLFVHRLGVIKRRLMFRKLDREFKRA